MEKKQDEDARTTKKGRNGTLDSLHVVDNCQTNRGTGGISALDRIRNAGQKEREEIKKHLNSMPTIPQNTRTSGQGNVL